MIIGDEGAVTELWDVLAGLLPPPRDVLEEHALDGILRTEREDLLEGRLEPIGHGRHRVTG